jgi:hypothetical protein
MKTLREYMDKLDEISRRDFLKGACAAAIAGAAGGAKAQDVNYAEAASRAVKKAQDAVGSFFSVKFGGERHRIMNYISTNVNRVVLAYCMDTNGYNINEVIDYANDFAYKQADAVPPAITDGGGAITAINVGNAFMNSYSAAILQKFNEYKKLGSQSQQPTNKSTSKPELTKIPEKDLTVFSRAMTAYIFGKDLANDYPVDKINELRSELDKFIQIYNAKRLVNTNFKSMSEWLKNLKDTDAEKYHQWIIFSKTQISTIINDLKKLNAAGETPEDEFKEDVAEQAGPDAVQKVENLFRNR